MRLLSRLFKKEPLYTPEFTPDFTELQDADEWPFFEYGDLKQGMTVNRMRKFHNKFGEPVGLAFTAQHIPLWSRNAGPLSYPIAVDFLLNQTSPKSHVMGELFNVPTKFIPTIDDHRMNGVYFDRKLVPLQLPDGSDIKAFMYKGRKDFWSKWIEWDNDFHRCEKDFSFIHPQRRSKISNDYYTTFTRLDFKEGANKCYLGFTNGFKPEPKQHAT